MRCDFQSTDRSGVYRCRRCGFVTLPTRFPPAKVHRVCRTFDLSLPVASKADTAVASRGLGDTVAKIIERVSLGQLKANRGCGCHRRQAWLNKTFPYRRATATAGDARLPPAASGLPSPTSILLRFPHGLGDAVQLTTVLRHLRRFRPHWQIDVAGKLGTQTLYDGLVRRALVDGRDPWRADQYTLVRTLAWPEPVACYADSPSTKAEKCLREVFRIRPDDSLCRYHVVPSDDARWAAHQYLEEIAGPQLDGGPFPVVIIHYQGNSARRQKNIDEEVIRLAVASVLQAGYVPVILDWETPPRSTLVRESRAEGRGPSGSPRLQCPGVEHPLWRATGCGDGGTIAALVQLSSLMIGIDSGPAHVAGATDTPAIVVWKQHHPIHYYTLAPNVTHLVSLDHRCHIRGDADTGERYFQQHYDHRTYQRLRDALPLVIEENLRVTEPATALQGATHGDTPNALIADGDMWVRRSYRAADMVIVRDVLCGDAYAIESLPVRPRTILDVGAHIGAFAVAAHRRWRDARIVCVEANRRNLNCLRANVAGFADVFHAAAGYEKGDVAMASTVFEGTENTGGSYVYVPRNWRLPATSVKSQTAAAADPHVTGDPRYRADLRAVSTITLEDVFKRTGWHTLDLLKLDCEGCEISLLENTTSLERVGAIVGEFHDRRWFDSIVARRFAGWRLRILHNAEPGTFWLVNLTR